MQDYEYNQVKKIVKRLTKRYAITSYRIDTVNDTVTISMKWANPYTCMRKVFEVSEILALSETDNRFYYEFNILWLSKRGEKI